MIRAIAFDFDGTLVDSNPIKRSAFYEVVAGMPGAARTLDQILKSPDSGDRHDIFHALDARLRHLNLDPEALARRYGEICESHILELLRQSRVAAFLDALKIKGYALFIVSATPQVDLVSMLRKTTLASRFTAILGGPKSKAVILRSIARRHGWNAQRMIMVGDGPPDCLSAAEFGCRFVGIGDDIASFGGPVDMLIEGVERLVESDDLSTIIEITAANAV